MKIGAVCGPSNATHIARLKRVVSKLKVPEDDRAFLREAIDFLAAERARYDTIEAALIESARNQPSVRLRGRGWEIDDWLGIRHYKVAGHHVTVTFDRGRHKEPYVVTVPALPDCQIAGHTEQDAINKIAAAIGTRQGKVPP